MQRAADLHMAQLMPLPLTVSRFSKIQIGFAFLVPAHMGSPGQTAIKRVCVRVNMYWLAVVLRSCGDAWHQLYPSPCHLHYRCLLWQLFSCVVLEPLSESHTHTHTYHANCDACLTQLLYNFSMGRVFQKRVYLGNSGSFNRIPFLLPSKKHQTQWII